MLRITTLIENSAGEHLALRHEHGLSFFVEKDGRAIVFDTGQSGAFIGNAARLKIDLSAPDYVVLSHGHYDHSGGLKSLAGVSGTFGLIVGQGFFREKYGFRNGAQQFLGNDFDEATANVPNPLCLLPASDSDLQAKKQGLGLGHGSLRDRRCWAGSRGRGSPPPAGATA